MGVEMAVKFTYLDVIVLLTLAIFAVINARKGIAGALLKFMPTLLAILMSWKLSGSVIKYVRDTAVFSFVMGKIENGLNLENILPDMAASAQNEIISGMPIPDFIKNAIVSNNNSVVYNIFNAETLQQYIAGFLTNILISIAVVVILYFLGLIMGKTVLKILDTANDLPVIGFFSKSGGFIIGLLKGVCVIWIAGIIITFFCYKPWAAEFISVLESSFAAGWLYKNNILLYVVLNIIA